jgi:hypothetical protein
LSLSVPDTHFSRANFSIDAILNTPNFCFTAA